MALRRQRIEQRIEAKKLGASGDAGVALATADDADSISRSVVQTGESRTRLDKINMVGNTSVTEVRTRGDGRENERRIAEELNRQSRRQKLLYEAESSARQNAAVAMKWSALFDKEIPQVWRGPDRARTRAGARAIDSVRNSGAQARSQVAPTRVCATPGAALAARARLGSARAISRPVPPVLVASRRRLARARSPPCAQELLAEIELQRETCARITQSKDHLIREFKLELKQKDDEYVKMLKTEAVRGPWALGLRVRGVVLGSCAPTTHC